MMRRVTTEWRLAQADGMDLPAPDACTEADDEGTSVSFPHPRRSRSGKALAQLSSTAWYCTDDLNPVRLMRPAAMARLTVRRNRPLGRPSRALSSRARGGHG